MALKDWTYLYWGIALDRKGRETGRVGPFLSREHAAKEIRSAHPAAHSYSVGYGNDGPNLDIRNERNLK